MSNPVSYGFLAPPAALILVCLAGALLALVRRRVGLAIVFAASLALYLLATPVLSSYLLARIEAEIPERPALAGAEAIVILGGDLRLGAGGEQSDTLGPLSLERVVYGADAYRRLHLPVAVSGGAVPGSRSSVARLMKAALESDFAVPVAWTEDRSLTTFENARETARLLQADRVTTVVLVTHAWHMPRSLWSFERVGLRALPWPAPRTLVRADRIDHFLPSNDALHDSFYALHEMLGMLYYRLRF